MTYRVEELTIADILDLRMSVLRRGTPSQSATYAEDDDPSTRHLGVRIDDTVVACSTWVQRSYPLDTGRKAMQLKGMAVADHLQGTGIGRDVLLAGIALAEQLHCDYVWARARNSAMGFYVRNGMNVVGEEFVDEATAMPHHLVMKLLNP